MSYSEQCNPIIPIKLGNAGEFTQRKAIGNPIAFLIKKGNTTDNGGQQGYDFKCFHNIFVEIECVFLMGENYRYSKKKGWVILADPPF